MYIDDNFIPDLLKHCKEVKDSDGAIAFKLDATINKLESVLNTNADNFNHEVLDLVSFLEDNKDSIECIQHGDCLFNNNFTIVDKFNVTILEYGDTSLHLFKPYRVVNASKEYPYFKIFHENIVTTNISLVATKEKKEY